MAKMNVGIETSSWINMAAGALIAVVAYFQTTSYNAPFYSGVISGVILVVIGAFTAWAGARDRSGSALWPSMASALVAAWAAAYPWFASVTNTYVYVTSGAALVVLVVSVYEAYAANRSGRSMPRRPTA
ncbi:MAG: hypothetical protein WDA16_06790 [Candidatus Thermoplasmatota archaeon]